MSVDVAVLFVGLLFGGGEGGNACGGCRFYDGVEIKGNRGSGLFAEVGKVERGLACLTLHAGDELTDFLLRRDGVDVDDIVGAGFWGIEAGTEGEGYTKAVSTTTGKLHHG